MAEDPTQERTDLRTARRTFVDDDLQAALAQDGYVVLDLLDAEQVAQLQRCFDDAGRMPGDPRAACIDTFFSPDAAYKERVDAAVAAVMGPVIDGVFDRQHVLGHRFSTKWPGERSSFGLHQDISVVDERRFRSVEIWCALVDTDEENGQLWVAPGSHRWRPRARPIHGDRPPFWAVKERVVAHHSRPVPLRAGQAIVFDHGLCHFSYANRSASPRVVAMCDLRPIEADALHYVRADDGAAVEAHAISDDFWLTVNPFNVLDEVRRYPLVDRFDDDAEPITDEDLDRFVADGRAIDRSATHLGPINTSRTWCHRCGSTVDVAGSIDPWLGNATLRCEPCLQDDRHQVDR